MTDVRVPDLQTVVQRLMRFWIAEGCFFVPSHDAPILAPLQHPRVFLGLFDDDGPRRTALLQPVRRPRDSRYGDQPYRLARHLQLQILLNPNPDDLMASYLRSLRAIGLQLDLHDVRFAESRWEMPALDTWGEGWSVRIDGMGVTRLTVLQAAGGVSLTPVRAEIVYGIERLTTCLAGAASAYDVPWASGGPSYGALHRHDEREHARFDLELVEVAGLDAAWRHGLESADRALAAGLGRTAFDAAMDALHALERQAARGVLPDAEYESRQADVAARVAAVVSAVVSARASRDDTAGARAARPEAKP